MKKKYFIQLILVWVFMIPVGIFAQTTFKIKAGLNLSDMSIETNNQNSIEKKVYAGFNIGPTLNFSLNERFSCEMSMFFSNKGLDLTDEDRSSYRNTTKLKMDLYYLNVPITAKYYLETETMRIYGLAGPYLELGLWGRSKTETTYQGGTKTNDTHIRWGSNRDKDDLKRLDYGILVGAEIQMSSVQFGVSYEYGFADISSNGVQDFKIRNRGINIHFGYVLGEF